MGRKQVMISGGFDPVHVGHIRMIQEASQWGSVIVVVNSDAWLKERKGMFLCPTNKELRF